MESWLYGFDWAVAHPEEPQAAKILAAFREKAVALDAERDYLIRKVSELSEKSETRA